MVLLIALAVAAVIGLVMLAMVLQRQGRHGKDIAALRDEVRGAVHAGRARRAAGAVPSGSDQTELGDAARGASVGAAAGAAGTGPDDERSADGANSRASGSLPGAAQSRQDGAGADEHAHPEAGDWGRSQDSFEDEATEEDPQHQETEIGKRLDKVAIVLNPSKFADEEAFRTRITEVIERIEGSEVAFYETTVEDPGRGMARQAVSDGADLVVAAGGDGTVRMVASELAGTDTLMSIIPAGTRNLLARNVELPLDDPAAAMTAILTGQDRLVDVGWLRVGSTAAEAQSASKQVFLVIAGFGADAEMIGNTGDEMKKRIGWIAYVFGGVKSILGRSIDVVVDLPDGSRHPHKARTVLLGNVGKLPGGITLMPDAAIDNGRLEVLVASWTGAAGFSQLASHIMNPSAGAQPKRRLRRGPRLSALEAYHTESIKVVTTKPQLVQLDGDTDVKATHLIAEVDPGVLHLRVPVSSSPTRD